MKEKDKNKNNNNNNNDADIEIIMGDDSELNFSEIKDSINTLRPKENTTKKKEIIIPKSQVKKQEI